LRHFQHFAPNVLDVSLLLQYKMFDHLNPKPATATPTPAPSARPTN
jgi:hypothetical protein